VPPNENGSAKLVGGQAKASGTLAEPGFLLCRASFRETPQSAPITALGGAGVAPLEIKPSLPVPDDFDAFWTAQKQKLAAVPAKATLTPDPASTETLEVFDAQVECLGAPVSGYFARPKGAAAKSRPAILTVHGAGVVSGNRSGAMRWGSEGALAMDINAHGIPNGKPAEFYKALAEGGLKDYRFRGHRRPRNQLLSSACSCASSARSISSRPNPNGTAATSSSTARARVASRPSRRRASTSASARQRDLRGRARGL
jgi:cephalosporin-C deacetylase